VRVPAGTLVYDADDDTLLADLRAPGERADTGDVPKNDGLECHASRGPAGT
jgi:GTPase involved in cell partitioning and DNA repair